MFICQSVSPSLPLVRFGKILRCSDKRIVNIMNVYLERNNMQVELIRFREHNIDFINLYVWRSEEFKATSPTERKSTTAYSVCVGQCIVSLETMVVDTARWSVYSVTGDNGCRHRSVVSV